MEQREWRLAWIESAEREMGQHRAVFPGRKQHYRLLRLSSRLAQDMDRL